MPSVEVLFYREDDEVPVLDWLDQINEQPRRRCIAAIVRLSQEGHAARRPLVESLGEGLYELRARDGRVNYRILYFFFGRTAVVLTSGFTKEREIPTGEIELALERRGRFERDAENHHVGL